MQPPIETSERTRRIIKLATHLQKELGEIQRLVRMAAANAIECGRLLTLEKAWVRKTFGSGQWEAYYSSRFAHVLPLRTAQHWMRLARQNRHLALSVNYLESNQLRNAVGALGLVPAKLNAVKLEDSDPLKHSTHNSMVNRFSAWQNDFRKKHPKGPTREYAKQLRKDFEPIIRWIAELESIRPAKPYTGPAIDDCFRRR